MSSRRVQTQKVCFILYFLEELLISFGLDSYMRSVALSRKLISGVSFPCALAYLTSDERWCRKHVIVDTIFIRGLHFIFSASIWGCPPLRHAVIDCVQRHPRT